MKKRTYGFFIALMCFLLAACVSIFGTSGSAEFVTAAAGQSVYKLDVAKTRGLIYDCDLVPLTGAKRTWVAAVAPTLEALGALEQATEGQYRERLAAALEDGKPFLIDLERYVDSPHLDLFSVPERYSADQLAPHVVGYLDNLGGGASGVELGMNDLLASFSGEAAVYYQMNALGHVVVGGDRRVEDHLSRARGGVQLTLSGDIQALVQQAGQRLGKGAVVITEVPNCELRAVASFPDFTPLDLASAAKNEDGALINRAFMAYAPGSVFKIIPAAVLLETAAGRANALFTCTGEINAGGLLFTCVNGDPHGEVDLQLALEKSCNCYFISAARSLGGQAVLGMAYNLGLGSSVEFCRGLETESGTLPAASELENARALANFAFGQGETTVTPVQVCAMMNAVAAGGVYTTPRLIAGIVDESRRVEEVHSAGEQSVQVMSRRTAVTLQNMLIAAAKEGTGRKGAPAGVTVGIKTGTAQTGVFDETGEELLNYWYSGFVCDEEGPRYCVTVLREGVTQDDGVTAGVFKEIAGALADR